MSIHSVDDLKPLTITTHLRFVSIIFYVCRRSYNLFPNVREKGFRPTWSERSFKKEKLQISFQDGSDGCWCELRMKSRNSVNKYKSCFLPFIASGISVFFLAIRCGVSRGRKSYVTQKTFIYGDLPVY